MVYMCKDSKNIPMFKEMERNGKKIRTKKYG